MIKINFFATLFLVGIIIQAQNQFIPKPKEIIITGDVFHIPNHLILSNNLPKTETDYLIEKGKDFLEFQYGNQTNSQLIYEPLHASENKNQESYEIQITKDQIKIKSLNNQGYFYAVQTLLQLLDEHQIDREIPTMIIKDEPKFKWRGMHLDVVRHFFSMDEVKRYLDYLAMYKINTFHWHLTDDQGWRIEIKKYPKLTEIGSKRKESMIGPYVDNQFDGEPHGGFYTQEEIKDVINYASKLHITIVPEIEMPGHALAALTAYPEMACTSGPFEVATKWGVFDDVFCPKEETFVFLENILSEVIRLFPSEYIHIGGDECPKTRWKTCKHCQQLIQDLHLKDEHGLQSYFISRIEKFVNENGRKIIGWDEIMQGGLAPNAAVMSWTGIEGGTKAAKSGHFAVMTPGGYCYFDHYQGDPQSEPLAFGGYTPLEKVYRYQPIPDDLSIAESQFILGAQGNLWTEYITDFQQVEYMLFPRLLALSEVSWGTSDAKNYPEFENRVIHQFKLLDKLNVNYSKSIYNVSGEVQTIDNEIFYELQSSLNPEGIRYTLDDKLPSENSLKYTQPIKIDHSLTLQAANFENGKIKSHLLKQKFYISQSSGKRIDLENEPHPNYAHGGSATLVDGILGNPKLLGKSWLGFDGKDLVAIVDLGEIQEISTIEFNAMENKGSWIHLPKSAEINFSTDGSKFHLVKEIKSDEIQKSKGKISTQFKKEKVRFIKFIITNAGIIPDGNPGAGSPAWLFVDELSVM